MKIQLTKIPSVVKRLDLSPEVLISETIKPEEGAVVVVKGLSHQGTNNILDFSSGRLGRLIEGDIIPGVLGKRRALREYSGDIPESIAVGDRLHLVCESGVIGRISGVDESWGVPMEVRVLGSVINQGKQLNIRDFAVDWQEGLPASAPIVAVVGTCMDIGKTTVICKLAKHFSSRGLRVAVAKLTGVAFTQDLWKMRDCGADPVLDFVDGGLPSTCGNPDNVLKAAFGILSEINQGSPDLIIAEFGDGIIGGYNVAHLLRHPDLQKHIRAVVVGCSDLVSVWGAKEILNQYGIPITLITGPAVNNDTGAEFIERNLGLPAESNLHEIPKTIGLVEERVLGSANTTMTPLLALQRYLVPVQLSYTPSGQVT